MSDDAKIQPKAEKPMFKHKSAAGKGDAPRKVSKQYWENWDKIDWHHNDEKPEYRWDEAKPLEDMNADELKPGLYRVKQRRRK